MEEWSRELTGWFNTYYDSFGELSDEESKNFKIKKDHSFRVADFSVFLAEKLGMIDDEKRKAFAIGLFHDIGRFSQLKEYGTFSDSKSVDHAEHSVKVLKEQGILKKCGEENSDIIESAILNHNKLKIDESLNGQSLLFAQLIRDADKIDILKVLSDYYSSRNVFPNHTLTWELPKGSSVSKAVSKEILAGSLVSKKNVISEFDLKIMQISWVYDLNFRPSFEYILRKRFLESIYSSLSKSDEVIEIHRQVKMYAENQLFV